MFWIFTVLSGICFMVAVGRTYSQYLDALEARWTMPAATPDLFAYR
jgi:hypothetical protein